MDKHVGYFLFLAIINKSSMNILVYKQFCGYMSSFFIDKYLGLELLSHKVDTC